MGDLKVFMVVTIQTKFFWIKDCVDCLVEAHVSEKHAVSIFRAEVKAGI
jgi:hypothetical protein